MPVAFPIEMTTDQRLDFLLSQVLENQALLQLILAGQASHNYITQGGDKEGIEAMTDKEVASLLQVREAITKRVAQQFAAFSSALAPAPDAHLEPVPVPELPVA